MFIYLMCNIKNKRKKRQGKFVKSEYSWKTRVHVNNINKSSVPYKLGEWKTFPL